MLNVPVRPGKMNTMIQSKELVTKTRTAVALSILFLAFSLPCRAEENTTTLTWSDLVRTASKQNPDLAAARFKENAARASYRGSFNGFLPDIGLSQRYSNSDQGLGNSRWTAQADASMNILDRGSFYDVKAAAASLDIAAAQHQLASADLRFNLFSAYVDLLFAQEQLKVAAKIRELRMNNSQMVSLKYQSGRESKGNSLQAEAELTQADADLAQAQRDLRAAQAELNRRLGAGQFSFLSVTGTWITAPVPPWPDTASMVAANPQTIVAQANVSLAKASLERTRSAFWPTLSANYARSFRDSDYFPKNPEWSASGVLSWPLFGQGLTAPYYNVSAARKEFHAREENLRAAHYQIRSALESAWSDWSGKVDQVRVQNKFLRAAQQRNDEAGIRYTTGLMSFENWESVVSDLVNFEKGYLRAQRDASLAEAAWHHALGKPLEEP